MKKAISDLFSPAVTDRRRVVTDRRLDHHVVLGRSERLPAGLRATIAPTNTTVAVSAFEAAANSHPTATGVSISCRPDSMRRAEMAHLLGLLTASAM